MAGIQARRGELVDVLELPGFAAEFDGDPGHPHVPVHDEGCESRELVVREELRGLGPAPRRARPRGRRPGADLARDTNDNVDALRFYQLPDSSLAELQARGHPRRACDRLKPECSEMVATASHLQMKLELERRSELP